LKSPSLTDPDLRIRILLTALAVAGCALFLGACGSDDSEGDPSAQTVSVTITDDGCSPPDLEAKSGSATFAIENKESDVNNEFEILDGDKILAERENLVAGLSSEVTIDLEPGTYDIVCGNPGNREPTGELTVTAS
jgi:iron uptake system component EfeO